MVGIRGIVRNEDSNIWVVACRRNCVLLVLWVGKVSTLFAVNVVLCSNPPDLRSVSDSALNPSLRRSKRE